MYSAFNNYVNLFDLSDAKVFERVEHCLRVASNMKKYAKRLGYSEDEVKLAEAIGLLHDIGYFNREDENLDHADAGIKLLFDEHFIEKCAINPERYETVKFAILNHNKLNLPKENNLQILKFAKLIRDVDKIDCSFIESSRKNKYDVDTNVSINVRKDFIAHKTINHKDIKNDADRVVAILALGFDINNDMCIDEFENNIVNFYNSRVPSNDELRGLYRELIQYLEKRKK